MTTATAEKPASIQMEEVTNSNQIAARGYDPVTKVLALKFKKGGGGIYRYSEFTPKHWDAFKKASSAGTFFHQHIRDKFAHTGPH